ncbi:glycosyltransferase [Thiothrix nivea]|uniref:Glycosyl transferase group 1 n=1 Tax=Thiothrix nivea (strain ATCC 35100 / DSM 5205 / JP2) TaxID=870187 RepID=A0A656HAW6_THINJ|nr:glycosyltransferase [Thiothrix nivea]EIJ34221.1 glycosyl transferase group 1 [Thiothrix nivea DSM 5205]
MKKILYITSTLKNSGPTNQLFNLIKYLDRSQFTPHLITLSPEPTDSRWKDYKNIGVQLHTLNLSRFSGMLFAKEYLYNLIKVIQPDLIHTQGIRADSLLASLRLNAPWVMTSRNFPPDDYPSKFGRLKGALMIRQHFSTMKHCKYLVTCSKTIQKKLSTVGIQGIAIQNGVQTSIGDPSKVSLFNDLPRPIFISVGSLIPRKNMHLLIKSFADLSKKDKGTLIILGDGPLMNQLSATAIKDVHLVGNVNNVPDYLAGADYFVSSSLSEGLPNTVLEALAAGLPVILSDIESHQEIAYESSKSCKIFSLKAGSTSLAETMASATKDFDDTARLDAKRLANDVFSAKRMSINYQEFYNSIWEMK